METNKFANRHIGVTTDEDKAAMLKAVGVKSTDELIDRIIPSNIRLRKPLHLPAPMTEREFAEHIAELASKNKIFTFDHFRLVSWAFTIKSISLSSVGFIFFINLFDK